MQNAENYARMQFEIGNFVDDLGNAINREFSIEADFDNIMICGMGGSAIGGDIITDFVIKREFDTQRKH